MPAVYTDEHPNAPLADRVKRYQSALALAFASPMIAELLSSSAPPLFFFVPWILALFVLFYGCGALLIRELTLRWRSGWRGILLLGSAFAILEEGISTRVFFDPASRSLGPLAGHGRWFGVNWIWTLDGILYHAVFSVALPILVVYQLFPQTSKIAWFGRRGLWLMGALFGFAASVLVVKGVQYPVPSSYIATCYAAIVVLVLLARRAPPLQRMPRPQSAVSPLRFAALGFGATAGLLLQMYIVPPLGHSPLITLAVLGALVTVSGRLLIAWAGSGVNWSRTQQCGLLVGALGCLALLAFFHEVNPTRTYDARGMSVVGAVTLLGLNRLWKRAQRN